MKNQTGSGVKLMRDDWHIIEEDNTVEPCLLQYSSSIHLTSKGSLGVLARPFNPFNLLTFRFVLSALGRHPSAAKTAHGNSALRHQTLIMHIIAYPHRTRLPVLDPSIESRELLIPPERNRSVPKSLGRAVVCNSYSINSQQSG